MNWHLFYLIIIAATLHGSWNFYLKKAHDKTIALWLGQLIGGIIFILIFRKELTNFIIYKDWYYLIILSGALHALYLNTLANAYKNEDVSIVLPTSRGTAIIGAAIIGCFLLNEILSLFGIIGLIITLVGVIGLNIKKAANFNISKYKNISYAACSGIFIAIYAVFDKHAVTIIPPLLYASTISIFTSILWAPLLYSKYKGIIFENIKSNFLLSAIVGIGGVASYCLVLFAFNGAPVVYVLAVTQFSIIIGVILSYFFLNENITLTKFISILAILSGIFLIKMS